MYYPGCITQDAKGTIGLSSKNYFNALVPRHYSSLLGMTGQRDNSFRGAMRFDFWYHRALLMRKELESPFRWRKVGNSSRNLQISKRKNIPERFFIFFLKGVYPVKCTKVMKGTKNMSTKWLTIIHESWRLWGLDVTKWGGGSMQKGTLQFVMTMFMKIKKEQKCLKPIDVVTKPWKH